MAEPADIDARTGQIDRIMRELAACEKLGDPELARRTGRILLSVVACATDALLADGGQALQSAPDKFGAYFDKAAAGYVQAIDGLAKRAALAQAAGNGCAAARAEDPLARSIAAWGSTSPRLRGEVDRASARSGEGACPFAQAVESPPHPDPLPASGEREPVLRARRE